MVPHGPHTVVPVSSGPDLSMMRATLAGRADVPPDAPVHVRAFVAWMRGMGDFPNEVASEVAGTVGAARSAVHVAALGFASRAAGRPVLPPDAFSDWLSWLTSRRYFVPGRPRAFEHDCLAMLGVALALRAVDAGEDLLKWLDGLAAQSMDSFQRGSWEWSLISAAKLVLGLPRTGDIEPQVVPELRVALTAKGVLNGYVGAGNPAWETIIGLDGLSGDAPRAAVMLAAFEQLISERMSVRLSDIEVEDVSRILKRVPSSLRRWPWEEKAKTTRSLPARWDVENEYHVQDLLWMILAPLFPDLEDEEYLKSLGQKHPRADLAIPSLGLIIEVKFLRPTVSFAVMIGEVSEDTGLYFCKGSPWQQMIVFVWDDSARTEEHHEFCQGVLQLPHVVDAVVVSRPAKMDRDRVKAGSS